MKSLAYEGPASRKALDLLRRYGLWINGRGLCYFKIEEHPQRKDRFFGNLTKYLKQELQ